MVRSAHRWMLVVLATGLVARAGTREDEVATALSEAKAAQDEADDASGSCRKKVSAGLESLIDRLKDLQREPSDKGLRSAKNKAEDLADLAKDTCSGSAAKHIARPLDRVVSALERAASAASSTSTSTAATAPNEPKGGLLTVGANIAHGIGGLFNGNASSNTSTSKSETSTTRRTETVNGRPVEDSSGSGRAALGTAKGGFGATCNHNPECESSTCFVGNGNVGYCTKMCDSFTDCPTFWECKRAANAPQKICLQK